MEYSNILSMQFTSLLNSNPDLKSWLDFACKETVEDTPVVSAEDRYLALISVCLGLNGKDVYKKVVNAALEAGIDPAVVREATYQSIAYLGMPMVYPFIKSMSKIFKKKGILLESGMQVQDRLIDGNNKQIELFGPGMKESWLNAPDNKKLINKYLADNCFGDYYTRKGLDNRQRELATFCYLAGLQALPQLTAHAGANMKNGNSEQYLIAVVDALVPYLGYPRSLNTLTCIENAAK